MRKHTLLGSDANYAKDHTTLMTAHSRKKGILLKRLITHSLEHPINLRDSTDEETRRELKHNQGDSASIDATIRNQGASIKTLEIQIGQMSKVLQERGIGGLFGSTEPNPRDHVKSISTAEANSSEICRMGYSSYAVSGSRHISMFSETVPFLRRLQNYCCDDWREAQDVKILEAYDHTLP
ncbi:hypothetical protein Tco_0102687 [Tanacetum coccineum]